MTLVLILLAAHALGRILVPGAGALPRTERLVQCFLLGAAGAGLVVLVVGSVSLTAAQVVLAGVAAAGLLTRRRTDGVGERPAVPPLDWVERAGLAAVTAALGLTFLGALAPVTGWDATVAHLALPADYAREGHIALQPGNVYSGYPHLAHCLYAAAYHHGGALPVSVLSWALGGSACAAVYVLGARLSCRRVGILAAALLATAPIYMDQAGTVSIDLAFAAFATAALAAVAAWFDEKRLAALVAAGLLAGSACGIRHTGYLVCAFLALAVLMGRSPKRFRATACFGLAALAAAAPWLVRSALLTGNPFFPLLAGWFPEGPIAHVAVDGAGVHESIARSGGISFLGFLRFPWDIIMRPGWYDGWNKSPGGLVLVLGLPGLLLGTWRVRAAGGYGVAGCALFYFYQRFARYMLPFFIPLMVVAAAATERAGRLRPVLLAAVAVMVLFGLGLHGAAVSFKVPVVVGLQSRDDYLAARVERYAAFQYANAHCADGTVLTVDQRSYYLDMPAFQNHWAMKRLAALPLGEQAAWLREHNIRYVMLPLDFIEESGALREDLGPMADAWRHAPRFFEPVGDPLVIPRPRGGLDHVVFLRVLPAAGD